MNKHDRYRASFAVNDEVVMGTSDNDKDKLLARAVYLIESASHGVTCSIRDTKTDNIIQTLKRSSME